MPDSLIFTLKPFKQLRTATVQVFRLFNSFIREIIVRYTAEKCRNCFHIRARPRRGKIHSLISFMYREGAVKCVIYLAGEKKINRQSRGCLEHFQAARVREKSFRFLFPCRNNS